MRVNRMTVQQLIDSVVLLRPERFSDSHAFRGLQHESTASSIMVTEIPGSYATIAVGFTPENLSRQGMTLLSRENVSIDGHPGLLLHVDQTFGPSSFRKWIVIFGNERETVLITATYPTPSEEQLSHTLRDAVLVTRCRKDDVTEEEALATLVPVDMGKGLAGLTAAPIRLLLNRS